MKIRLVGSKDLIQDIYDIFKLKVKIYEDKYNPNNSRIYVDADDRIVAEKLRKLRTAIVKINQEDD